jgi:hypothetical protein
MRVKDHLTSIPSSTGEAAAKPMKTTTIAVRKRMMLEMDKRTKMKNRGECFRVQKWLWITGLI